LAFVLFQNKTRKIKQETKVMKLKQGETATDFAIKDIYGKNIKLSDFKGKKILLSFFRNVNCPFCNLRVHDLTKRKQDFDKQNFQMIFLFESSPKLLLISTFHQGISPIPLIGDPEKLIYKQYQVEASLFGMLKTFIAPNTFKLIEESKKLNLPKEEDKAATKSLMPADFLIDENFVIQQAYYGQNMADHIPLEAILGFAK
jgi:thioredoxin-dependent peroxiredoxin